MVSDTVVYPEVKTFLSVLIKDWSEIEAQGVGECIVSYFLCFVFNLTIQIHSDTSHYNF